MEALLFLVLSAADRLPSPDPQEYSNHVEFFDANGDGALDVVVANGPGYFQADDAEPTRLFLNDGKGFFTEATAKLEGNEGHARDAQPADVDGDGDFDLLIANTYGEQSRLLINDGAGNFGDETDVRLPDFEDNCADADFGDVDGDGDLDLFLTNWGENPPGPPGGQDRLLINDGTGVFEEQTVKRLPEAVVAGTMDADFFDFDADLDLDLIINSRDERARLWVNDGAGYFEDASDRLDADSDMSYEVEPCDIDGDGDLDLVFANGSENLRELLLVFDGERFVDETERIASNPIVDDNEVDCVDLDGDGDRDLLVASLQTAERALENDGTGTFTHRDDWIEEIVDSTLSLELRDLDGDNAIDMVTAQGESGDFTNRFYLGQDTLDPNPPVFITMTELSDTDQEGPYAVLVAVRDALTSDTGPLLAVSLRVRVEDEQDILATWVGGDLYRAQIPTLAVGTSVTYQFTAIDDAQNSSQSTTHIFRRTGAVDAGVDGEVDGGTVPSSPAGCGCSMGSLP